MTAWSTASAKAKRSPISLLSAGSNVAAARSAHNARGLPISREGNSSPHRRAICDADTTSLEGGASCPVMGAVFKTVSGCARAYLGGFDSHTPPPIFLFGNCDFGLRDVLVI